MKLHLFIACNILFSFSIGVTALRAEDIEKTAPASGPSYYDPKINNYRIDFCYNWAKKCGDFVADSFCKSQGHSQSITHIKDENVGENQKTYVMGDGVLCIGKDCDSFSKIVCTHN